MLGGVSPVSHMSHWGEISLKELSVKTTMLLVQALATRISVDSSCLLIWRAHRSTALHPHLSFVSQNIRNFFRSCRVQLHSPLMSAMEREYSCVPCSLCEMLIAAVNLPQRWVWGRLLLRQDTCLLATWKHFRCLWADGIRSSRQTPACGWLPQQRSFVKQWTFAPLFVSTVCRQHFGVTRGHRVVLVEYKLLALLPVPLEPVRGRSL